VADPGLLYTRALSPQFLERRNLTRLFGSSLPVTVERLRNPAGREFQVVSFQKAGTGTFSILVPRVADPHSFHPDPDPAF
jgi:hypothetical protein